MTRIGWAAAAVLTAGALAQSQVRMVRLSVAGHGVEALGAGAPGWHAALEGEPVVEGERLRTPADGVAEVQLECGSALRLGPGSELRLVLLAGDARGRRESVGALSAGSARVTLYRGDLEGFRLDFGRGELRSKGEGRARIEITAAGAARVAVLQGEFALSWAGRAIPVKKDHLARLAADGGMTMTAGAPAVDAFERWARERDAAHDATLAAARQRAGRNLESAYPEQGEAADVRTSNAPTVGGERDPLLGPPNTLDQAPPPPLNAPAASAAPVLDPLGPACSGG